MRRKTPDVKACHGPARPPSSSTQATDPAEHADLLALVRTRRRWPTLLASVRSRLGQEAEPGKSPPRSPTPPPTSDPRDHRAPVVPSRPAPTRLPALRASGRPDDAA